MNNWREVKLGELGKVIAGGTPSTKTDEYWNGSIGWVTPRDLSNYNSKYISNGERNITDRGLKESSAKLMPKGSILMTSRAPIGYLAIANNDISTNQGFKNIVCNEELVNNEFLYYYLKSNMEYIKLFSSGATFPEISGKKFKNIKIQIPDLKTQEKIADVLSTYDELIENNNRRIEILEKTAEEIYKEWFVRMRFPGYENTRFIKGIPEGWEVKRVGNITPILTGKKDANYAEDNGKYLFFTCSQTPLRSNGYSFDSHSVILAGNGDFNVKIYRGKFEAYQRTYVLTPHDNKYLYLLYFIIEKNIDWLINQAAGTVIRYLTRGMIERIPLLIPNNHLLNYYNEHIKNIFELRDNIELQNQNLIKQRDLLLPRLMNGTIEVK